MESMNGVVFGRRGRPEKSAEFYRLEQNSEQKALEFAQEYFLTLLNGNYEFIETQFDNPETILSDIEQRICNSQRAFTDFTPEGWNHLTKRVREPATQEIALKLIEFAEQIEYASLRNAHSSFVFLIGIHNLASIMDIDILDDAMSDGFGKQPNDLEFLRYVNQQLKPKVMVKAREMYS